MADERRRPVSQSPTEGVAIVGDRILSLGGAGVAGYGPNCPLVDPAQSEPASTASTP